MSKFGEFAKTFLYFVFKAIFFLILLGIILGAVWAYACVFKFPDLPEWNFPEKIVDVWEKITSLQRQQCSDLGYWFGEDATRHEKLMEASEVVEEGVEKPVVEESEPQQCGSPSIRVEPPQGEIGSTFKIFLSGFSPNDKINTCWYYPDGEEINCTILDANEEGNRETTFWSESDDPPGEYGMNAVGVCSSVEITWIIGN